MLINLRDKLLRRGGQTSFSKHELSLMLSIYGECVQNGEWKDYAIDNSQNTAVFSIFKSSKDSPLYSISKISSNSISKPSQFVLDAQGKVIKKTTSLQEIVDYLKEHR